MTAAAPAPTTSVGGSRAATREPAAAPRIVRGGLVVRPAGGSGSPRSTVTVGDLSIGDGGRFVAAPASPGADSRVLDATGTVVLPGFVDAHEHLRSFAPGSRDHEGQALPDLLASAARASEAADAPDYRALTALAAARLVRVGVTSVIDQIYPLHRPGMLRATVEGHRQVGIRASVGVGIMTRVPAAIRADPQQIFRLIEQAADDLLPAEQVFVAPVSLRQTDLDAYRAAVAFATRRNLRLYTHISESTDEVEGCLAEHGMRPVQLLRSIGFLRPGTVLVHCVHLDDADIAAIADSGAQVVYCPTNHLWLAKGTAPVLAMRGAGIDVCLGLDGMGDPFAEMRQAIFAQGLAAGNPGAMSTETAFALETVAGARVFDAASVTGTLQPGAPADYATVRAADPALQPMADPLYSVVRHATGPMVRDAVIGGAPVLLDGRLTRVDAAELVDKAWEAVTGIAARAGSPLPARADRDRLAPRPAEDRVTEVSPVPHDSSRQ